MAGKKMEKGATCYLISCVEKRELVPCWVACYSSTVPYSHLFCPPQSYSNWFYGDDSYMDVITDVWKEQLVRITMGETGHGQGWSIVSVCRESWIAKQFRACPILIQGQPNQPSAGTYWSEGEGKRGTSRDGWEEKRETIKSHLLVECMMLKHPAKQKINKCCSQKICRLAWENAWSSSLTFLEWYWWISKSPCKLVGTQIIWLQFGSKSTKKPSSAIHCIYFPTLTSYEHAFNG